MASTSTILPFWEVAHGQSAECFAIYARCEELLTKRGEAYFKCYFRARHEERPAMIWSNHAYFPHVGDWKIGEPYRLKVIGDFTSFGNQIKLLEICPAGPDDEADGFSLADLIESSIYNPGWLWTSVCDAIRQYVKDPQLLQLLRNVFRVHEEAFKKHSAAVNMHHAYSSGLLEHVWSLTKLCGFMADHYAEYYKALNPPLDKGILMTAAILHDVGKLIELEFRPFETRYSREGLLIGHIVLGRDIVRESASLIPDFPGEKLLRLEHAILAHHGKKDFGSPVVPQTIEALIVSFADEMDAKIHAVARALMKPTDDLEFTEKVFSLDNRRFYRGTPQAPTEGADLTWGEGQEAGDDRAGG